MSASSLPKTMKEAVVHKPLSVKIHEIPVPTPSADQVLIRVVVSGSNPKDWKYPLIRPHADGTNQGDDIAGTVVSVGSSVTQFAPGQRVAAFHQMQTPGGSYAEYALAPEHTTFHIPAHTSYEEAATIPLAAMTAAVGLFSRLGLPEPWVGRAHPDKLPRGGIVIYGAAGSVGAFAVQLARHAGIHPILAVAGNGIPFVESLIDKSKGDVVIDYRKGNDSVIKDLKAAIPKGEVLNYAFDCVAEKGKASYDNILAVLEPSASSYLTTVLPMPDADKEKLPEGLKCSFTMVGSVHGADKDLGYAWFRLMGLGLKEGWFKPHPYEVVPGGLGGVETGLRNLKEGKASAIKYVFRVGETEGLSKL